MHGGIERAKITLQGKTGHHFFFFLLTKHFVQLHTDMRHSLFSEKFGVMVTSSFSARNSTSAGSITMAQLAASAEPKLRKITGVMRGIPPAPFFSVGLSNNLKHDATLALIILEGKTVCRSQLS